jgi:protoporphyrinogen/coproporphyrinogen III oxidase
MMKRVAIVGSGISALASAVALKQKGIDFAVFEKDPAIGGKLLTERIDGLTVEGGPDSFLPEKYWTVDLIKRVGLEEQLLCSNDEYKGTYIYSRGRLHRLPEGVMLMVPTMIMPLLRSSLISLPGKLRMGMDLFVPRSRDGSDESLAHFVTRRLGKECLDKIAEPLVAGIHTSNPDNMSVRAIFPRFLEMEQKHGSLIKGMAKAMKGSPSGNGSEKKMTYFMSLNEGMQQLAEGCARFIGETAIHTSTTVKEVRQDPQGYELDLGTHRESFGAVILTTPSYVTKDLIQSIAPNVSEILSLIEWSSTATISIAFSKKDIKSTLPGFGFIVPKIEERRVNAATWSSIKWSFRAPPEDVLIRSFVGGGHHEELVTYDDEALVRVVTEELRDIVGITAKPHFAKVYRWHRSMPRYTVGHLGRIASIEEARRPHPGLFLAGSSYRGIGIGDCVKSGFEAASDVETLFGQQTP